MEWIDVRDRTPELGEECLVCYRRDGVYYVDITYYLGEKPWYFGFTVGASIIKYWIPLPEPPKG